MPSGFCFSLGLMDGAVDRAFELRMLFIYTIAAAHSWGPSGTPRLWDSS